MYDCLFDYFQSTESGMLQEVARDLILMYLSPQQTASLDAALLSVTNLATVSGIIGKLGEIPILILVLVPTNVSDNLNSHCEFDFEVFHLSMYTSHLITMFRC